MICALLRVSTYCSSMGVYAYLFIDEHCGVVSHSHYKDGA